MLKQNKSVQVKAIHNCLKGRNVQKAIFYWNAKITCFRWLSLSKKSGLYNTYHELLSDILISRVVYYITPISSNIRNIPSCGLYWILVKSLEGKVDKSAVATSYQVDWIDYTLQNILGQKFWQYKIKNAKAL